MKDFEQKESPALFGIFTKGSKKEEVEDLFSRKESSLFSNTKRRVTFSGETPESEEEMSVRDEDDVIIKFHQPKVFDDAELIARNLKEGIPVIVNIEETDKAESRRILDFLSGVVYSIGAKPRKISEKIFYYEPSSIAR